MRKAECAKFSGVFPFQAPTYDPLPQEHPHLFISKLHLLPDNTQPERACKGSSISGYIPFIKERTGQKHCVLSSLTSTFLISKTVKQIHCKTRYRMGFPDTRVQLYPPEQTKAPNDSQNSWLYLSSNISNLCDLRKKK